LYLWGAGIRTEAVFVQDLAVSVIHDKLGFLILSNVLRFLCGFAGLFSVNAGDFCVSFSTDGPLFAVRYHVLVLTYFKILERGGMGTVMNLKTEIS
jgi:hypothetical protein